MGRVMAVCASALRGVKKTNIGVGDFIENYGLKTDGHAGEWHRQVSLLSYDCVQAFCAGGAKAGDGDFGENLLVRGIDFKMLPVGTKLYCGSVILEITQIGKECHSRCRIYEQMGDCIMPREGVFARVLRGGKIAVGDELFTL